VKQILHKAKEERFDNLVKNTMGIVSIDSLIKYMLKICRFFFLMLFWLQVFYSCPHFGSKLADMPWRMGFVLRPAPTVSI